MTLWERWKKSQASAARWDHPAPGDARILNLKRLLRAAPRENGRADDLLWQRIRRQLKPFGFEAPAPPPLFTALASMGPRFAVAAAAVLMLSLGLYALPEQKPDIQPPTQVASLENASPLSNEPFEIQSGDELLQYIAYGTNR
ncbi:MAG: hypothetical protein O2807_12570 [bacterium]|nr:hypothetical protein [bacterium]